MEGQLDLNHRQNQLASFHLPNQKGKIWEDMGDMGDMGSDQAR
jgi:hypothetical protein